MSLLLSPYIAGTSYVHQLDARIKLVLLIAYSISLFFIDTWAGMALAVFCFAVVFGVSRLPLGRVFGLAVPLYILAALTLIFNTFTFMPLADLPPHEVAAGVYTVAGPLSLTVAGFLRGCFFAVRIVVLVLASLVVSFTTPSSALIYALTFFLKPLRRFHVPVDDIAMVFSIALRFIPLTAEEFFRIKDAQWSRGSRFDEGSLIGRLKAWQTVFIPALVGLFRRADNLAQAMDARCYGVGAERTSIDEYHVRASSISTLIIGLCICVLYCVL